MKRVIVGVFVALAIGVTWVPAASAATVSVEQFVNGVCSSVATFESSIEQASQVFQESTATLNKVPAVKTQFVSFLESIHDAVTELQTDLAAVGTPQVEHGAKMAKQLRGAIAKAETVMADALDTAASLKTTKPKQFATDVTALSTKIDKAFSGIGDGISNIGKKYDSSGLDAAEKADTDCTVLNS